MPDVSFPEIPSRRSGDNGACRRGPTVAAALVAAVALLVGGASPGGPSAAAAAAVPVIQPTGMFHLFEVSHTARWLGGIPDSPDYGIPVIIDRETGTSAPGMTGDAWRITGFVRDNPDLRLEVDSEVTGYVFSALWLHNVATGTRQRVDTDSAGNPLFSRWMGVGHGYEPTIAVSPKSVSRDGRYVAMCVDDVAAGRPFLFVKDLVSGELRATRVACGVGSSGAVLQPEISANGKVVHVNGDVDDTADEGDPYGEYFLHDRLVFPRGATVKVRRVNGWGSMTRDGRTLFMIRGTRAVGARKPSGKVGAYNIRTRKTKRLSGRWAIYGNQVFWNFSAFDKASFRGRYVVHGTKPIVIDRKTGRKTDIGALMTAAGYPPTAYVQSRISGDGRVVFVLTPSDPTSMTGRQYVAVSGWRR